MRKLFVWDFHGVLEKGNEYAVVEVTNQVLEEFEADARLDIELCRKLYGRKWHKFFRLLCPDADEETIIAMVDRGVDISRITDVISKYIKPMDYAKEVLSKIKKAGHDNIIVSNTEPDVLKRYLDAVEIKSLVMHDMGADSHKDVSGKNSKIGLLKEFLKSKDYDEIISIGDLDTDIELGKSIGATTYLFSQTGKFSEIDAHYKISDLREVLKEL